MDLEKLKTFVRIVESGSLSAASRHLGLGPSALSRQMAVLESEMRGRLLHRTGRGVEMTDLGERILPRARRLIEEAEALEAEVAASSGVFRGNVHVAAVPAIAGSIMTKVVYLARQKYPDVVIHVMVGLTGQVEQWIQEGKADLGFVLKTAPMDNQVPLASSRMLLVGKPGDHFTQPAEIAFRRLDGVPLIRPGGPSGFRRKLEDMAMEQDVTLNFVAEIDSHELTKQMVSAGVGYALMAELAVQQEIEDGRLSASVIVQPGLPALFYLVHGSQKNTGLATRELSRFMRNVAEEMSRLGTWR
jgi:LysR family transcriptional regulator, nitrogen assimilation regulatory protein